MVELHWGFVDRQFSLPLDAEGLWGRLERVSLDSGTVPTLSPEDLLLILCMHGSVYLWERLGWICDVAELIHARKGVDWEWVTEQAAALGGERMFFLGLYLASDLLGAPLPRDVLHKVEADPTVKVLAREVHERLSWEVNNSPPPVAFGEIPFHLRMRERLRDKIWYLVDAAMTPTVNDWRLLPLSVYFFPAYYVVRPIRLTGKYGRRLLGCLS
jgi:hypothetical protein